MRSACSRMSPFYAGRRLLHKSEFIRHLAAKQVHEDPRSHWWWQLVRAIGSIQGRSWRRVEQAATRNKKGGVWLEVTERRQREQEMTDDFENGSSAGYGIWTLCFWRLYGLYQFTGEQQGEKARFLSPQLISVDFRTWIPTVTDIASIGI